MSDILIFLLLLSFFQRWNLIQPIRDSTALTKISLSTIFPNSFRFEEKTTQSFKFNKQFNDIYFYFSFLYIFKYYYTFSLRVIVYYTTLCKVRWLYFQLKPYNRKLFTVFSINHYVHKIISNYKTINLSFIKTKKKKKSQSCISLYSHFTMQFKIQWWRRRKKNLYLFFFSSFSKLFKLVCN